MTRATFVKKARKPNPVVTQDDIDRAKAGEDGAASYWWWSFRFGPTRYSKTRPRNSQLTQSEFFSAVYELQEQIEDFTCDNQEDLRSARDEWRDRAYEIAEECREKYDNMPDGLRDGDTGCMLDERASAMEAWAEELDQVCLDDEDYGTEPEEGEGCQEEAAWVEEKLEELKNCEPDV